MSLKHLFFIAVFMFALAAPGAVEATEMSCDTQIRQTYSSSQTGFNLKDAWAKQTSSYNAYICAAAQMNGTTDPNCYNWMTDPKNPFQIISSSWGANLTHPDERPLNPPEQSDPYSVYPFTQTTWNSCAAYCSSIEDGQYCIGLGMMCHVVKLKSNQSPSSIRTVSIPPGGGGTFGCGYGTFCQGVASTEYQSGVCVPRPPTATLTATPSTINQGSSSMLTWNSYNVDQCTGVGFDTGGAVTGSVNVTPSATTNYTLNCTGGAGPASASATVTVIAAAAPDLTAGGITPTSATAGTATSFSATVSNIGGASAGASATRFQRATSAAGAGATTISDVSTAAIAAGGSLAKSASYTFPSAGTYYVRACADIASAVTESNEGNNCGPWTSIVVSGAPVPSSVSCTVNSQSVPVGGSVTYTAVPVGAATSPYSWTGSDGATGFGSGSTATRTFSTPGTYGMQVSASGASSPAQCPLVSVAANWCTGTSPDLTITATPNRVRTGQTATLTWSATNVPGQNATCTVTGPGVSWTSTVSSSPSCSAGSSATVTIQTQSVYTLTCGSATETAVVNVIPNVVEF